MNPFSKPVEPKKEVVPEKSEESNSEYCQRRLREEGVESNIPVTDSYWQRKQSQ